MDDEYRPRLVDRTLTELVGALPAVLVVGPRAAGKTTTARRLAASVVRLDRPAEAAAFHADPDAALTGFDEPLLLDEWQAVPEVLGALKRAVDDDWRPGRFLLTGSVRADLDAQTWPGTGRLVRLGMFGLTVREIDGSAPGPTFLEKLSTADIGAFGLPPSVPDLIGYLELALRGGFPDAALRLDGTARRAWLDSYLDQLLTRDATLIARDRDPVRLRRYFEAVALNSAGTVEDKTLYESAGIDRKTALDYDRLLTNLLVVDNCPAWATNRLSRLVKRAKRYVVDPSLIGSALRLDLPAVLRDGNLLGRLIDTFVVAQIRPELAVDRRQPRLYHLRDAAGRHEIDLLAELSAEQVVAIEVKAAAAPSTTDTRHLAWLRDELGDRFLAGALLHTGPRPYVLDDRIFALPICVLWG